MSHSGDIALIISYCFCTIGNVLLGSLAGWQLALIIVGSIIGFILLLVIIIVCCCLWKKKSNKTSNPDKSSKARPSSNEHIIRRAIPPSESANRQQRPSTPNTRSTSLEHTEQRERRQSLSYDHYLRPIIPQPTSKSYDSSSQQDVLYARPQTRPLNHERFPQLSTFQPMSPSFDPKYQLEVPRDRRTPLESNDDDIILRF